MSVEEWYDTTCDGCGVYRCKEYYCDQCVKKKERQILEKVINLPIMEEGKNDNTRWWRMLMVQLQDLEGEEA